MSAGHSTVTYKDIPGFTGYRAGDDGSVWTARGRRRIAGRQGTVSVITDTWRPMKQRRDRTGRMTVMLSPARTPYLVHRLVLLAFVGPCPDGMECCHNDGNATNNRLGNLRWDTRESNYADRARHGKMPRGEAHHSSKLTADTVRSMRAEYAAGGVTLKTLAARHGVDVRAAHRAIRRETWVHVF